MITSAAFNIAFLVSAVLLLIMATVGADDDVKLSCNAKKFSGDDADAAITTKDKLLDSLVANSKRQLCTKQKGAARWHHPFRISHLSPQFHA
ncbi:hypothetical protein LINGRAHAP2_LOCUS31428 [Linum grandiflorum]